VLCSGRWLAPLSEVPFFFFRFAGALSSAVADEPALAREAAPFAAVLVPRFLERSAAALHAAHGVFRQFMEALANFARRGIFRARDLPLMARLALLRLIAAHARRNAETNERAAPIELLREIGGAPVTFEAAEASTRDAIARNLLGPLIFEGHFENLTVPFAVFTWLLFECAEDPLAPRGKRDKLCFLDASVRSAPEVEAVLREREVVRVRWLRAVLRLRQNPDIAMAIHETPFVELLAAAIALTLGTPGAGDVADDPDVLLLFAALLDAVPAVPITRQLLKTVVGKMRGSGPTAEGFAQVFAALTSEKFERQFIQAIAGPVIMRM
jgi:hypothetical protein